MPTNGNNSQTKDNWNKQAQLEKNQPLMELIDRWRQQRSSDRSLADEKYANIEMFNSLLNKIE